MRKLTLGAILAAVLASPAAAQAPPVKILSVKVGLPPGRFVAADMRDDNGSASHVAKNNTWAPVYVDLEITKEVKRKAAIVIESKDADDLLTTTWVPLPDLSALPPGTQIQAVELPRLPYLRPAGGGRGDEVVVAVRSPDTGDPSSWRNLSEPARLKYLRTRDVARYIVLSLGTKLPGFDLPKENPQGDNVNAMDAGRALRNGRIETAAITEVAQMPDRWFGYEAADLVVLTTGATDDNFLNTLFQDPAHKPRLEALVEWVRRGGRLVVSIGSKAPLVTQYEALREILPADISKVPASTDLDELSLDWFVKDRVQRVGIIQPRVGGKIPVANITAKPDRGYRRLAPYVSDPGAEALSRPVVVQSAYGLGRVTLVTIDLDRSPFLDLEPAKKADFWDLILKEAGAAKASSVSRQRNVVYYGPSVQSDTEDNLAGQIRTHVDTFEGVPVISFGWVAVFILLYTLLIGPVEYFILKKVFKRLELTWITFPIIVLTVSAIAYFTAYSLKGDDLKINKLDVVDVDPASNRVYGRSWFTIFSPRIETYTITTEPAAGWAARGTDQPAPLVGWVGGSGSGRGGIFSRRYQYHCDPDTDSFADGLVGVPIQVWSTKAFSSEWSAKPDRAEPLVVSNLIHPPANRQDVAGTFTLNLPIKELRDVRLIYAGKAYKYDNPVTPGATVNVLLDKAEGTDWVNAPAWGGAVTPTGPGPRKPVPTFAATSLMSALFHEAAAPGDGTGAQLENASLRRLDQSWRLSAENRDEVILVGRVEPAHGSAEALMTDPAPASPTVLWLKGLPGGAARQPVPGTMRQETFVRVFVPIKPAAKK